MDNLLTYLIIGVSFIGVVALIIAIASRRANNTRSVSTVTGRKKTQAQIIKEANRRLARDPHDPNGLIPVGEIYYENRLWDKAFSVYDVLSRMAADRKEIDAFKANQRAGICLIQMQRPQEALNFLALGLKLNPHDFECNYFMGKALFEAKIYDKAVPFLKKSLVAKPDAEGVYLILGQSLYYAHHFKEAMPCFKKALDEDPSNKTALYCMADCMDQSGNGDKAIKVFVHLRPDPEYGAKSCLSAGLYHTKMGDVESAIQDFEIGLKHENAAPEIRTEIQYRLAQQYFAINQISKGLMLLKQVRSQNVSYKDVNSLISRYQELSQNTNLQVYLSSNNSDFVPLCRKFIAVKYKKSSVKIIDINVGPLFTDILAEISSGRWDETEIFRFFRSSGATGEFYVRDLHGRMQDIKADKGFCVTAGVFSDDTHKFIEGRPVDLIEKTELTRLLKEVQL